MKIKKFAQISVSCFAKNFPKFMENIAKHDINNFANNQNCYTAPSKRASTAATFSTRDTVEQETKSVAIPMQWHTHQQLDPSITRRNPTSRWRRQCTKNAWQVCDATLQGPTNTTADVPILPNRSEQSDMSLVSEERPLPYVRTVRILPLSYEICL